MKHVQEWETCDQCGKNMTPPKDTPTYKILRDYEVISASVGVSMRGHSGKFCSKECALKWFERKVGVVLGLYDGAGSDDRILDLTTDVWGGAGPDCRTMPVLAGCSGI